MLVLSIKKSRRVVIIVPPSDTETVIEVEVTKLSGYRASLGFEAPRQVRVLRKELQVIPPEENAA